MGTSADVVARPAGGTKATAPARPERRAAAKGAAAFLLICGLALLSLYTQQKAPAKSPASAPGGEFSSERAVRHLGMIARDAHPIGSAEHASVRDYLVGALAEMGLSPEVQKTTAVNRRGEGFAGAVVENVLARLKGASGDKAVLLVAHYDSVPTGPGANDDGAAVAALLETARALRSEGPLKNDVIFLFTDGEEAGLLGAKAFADEHPWAGHVGLVMNFEARGHGGPAFMYETSDQNGWLISEFARAAPRPVANSLTYEIYKRMPNDTDMSVFKRAGFQGLNFAYIGGVASYHTRLDRVENVDERSVQHHGTYALALARHFGGLDLGRRPAGDAVYFNLPGLGLIHYPSGWAVPLALLVLALFVAVAVLGFRRGRLTLPGVAMGFVLCLAALVGAVVWVTLIWWVTFKLIGGDISAPQSISYDQVIYQLAFVALAVAISSAILHGTRRRVGADNLAVGAALWAVLSMVLSSLFFVGGSYLFTFPLLFSLLSLGYLFAARERGPASWSSFAVMSLLAVPTIILLTPVVGLLFAALPVVLASVGIALVLLMIGLLTPLVSLMTSAGKWALPGAAAAVCVALVAAGFMASGFDREQPKPASLFYGLDADRGEALWVSPDYKPDAWTAQFFDKNVGPFVPAAYFPSARRPFLKGDAPVAQLPPPRAELLDDQTRDGVRTLLVRVSSARQAPVISLHAGANTQVLEGSVNGRKLKQGDAPRPGGAAAPWALDFHAPPPEGIELTLQVNPAQPVSFRVSDQSYGLPELPGMTIRPRPDHMIPAPLPYSDSTLVTKTYTF